MEYLKISKLPLQRILWKILDQKIIFFILRIDKLMRNKNRKIIFSISFLKMWRSVTLS